MRLLSLLVGLTLLMAGPALANSGPPRLYGERSGVLVSGVSSAVAVNAETLHFELSESLGTAAVTATYLMELTGSPSADVEMAFVFVTNGKSAQPPVISVDGQPLAYSVLTEAEQYALIIDGWLAAHPAVAEELEAFRGARSYSSDDSGPLVQALVDVGFAPPTSLGGNSAGTAAFADDVALALVEYLWEPSANPARDAARFVDPAQTEAVVAGWSAAFAAGRDQLLNPLTGELAPAEFYSSPGELNWLLFTVPMTASVEHEVTVAYAQVAARDLRSEVSTIYQYDYLLSPASAWASFGPLSITVQAPVDVALASTVPLAFADGVYAAALDGLPEGELTFSVMAKEGLVPGVRSAMGYWNLLAGLVALLSAPIAWQLGRAFSRLRVAWLGLLFNLVGTFIVGLCASAAIMALLLQFWRLELFTGGSAWFGWFWVPLVATMVNLVISFIAYGRFRRLASPPV